jgi:hypothetical protein
MHVTIIVLKTAYDFIPRCKLWEAVEKLKINPLITELIKDTMYATLRNTKHNQSRYHKRTIKKGMWFIAVTLLHIYTECELLEWRNWNSTGWNFPVYMKQADDQIFIARTELDLEYVKTPTQGL